MKQWMKSELPEIADALELQIKSSFHVETEDGLNIAGRNTIYAILDDLIAVLFPGSYSASDVNSDDLNHYLNAKLRNISHQLARRIMDILSFHCPTHECSACSCEGRANNASMDLVRSLPEIRAMLMEDIKSSFAGDPAAQSYQEIILSYPYIEAIATQRIAHTLYLLNIPIIPRIMTERAHSHTGIDIHPGAEIGKGFFIDHGTGVVIGETSRIGENVTIYHGVTLGAFSPFDREENKYKGKKRHPDIEDNCIIYSGAVILGGNTVIGKGSTIGGNTWITTSVPEGSVVYSEFNTVIKKTKAD